VSDDAAFADDLAELWEHRTERQKRDIALRWLHRCFELLGDVCEREDLQGFARDCRELAPGPRLVAIDVAALALHEVADQVAKGSARARAIATLMRGVASVAADTADEPLDPPLRAICLRVRQAARAARVLDDESRRLQLDLVDA
jgi:hypothetical protein